MDEGGIVGERVLRDFLFPGATGRDVDEARNRGRTCAAIVFYRLDRSEETWTKRLIVDERVPP